MTAAILLGGKLAAGPALAAAVAAADLVVAADGGIRHAAALGRTPDLWVGDFDSSPKALRSRYAAVPKEPHPREKDATDGELAVRAALGRGARALLLLGALGGEPDHALAHLGLALALAEEGIEAALTDGRGWAWPLVPPGRTLVLPPGTRFSLVPWGSLEALSIAGARWTLKAANLPLGSTRTLRNRATGPVRFRLWRGRGIVFAWPAEPQAFLPSLSSPAATS